MQIVDISETTFASYTHNTVALKILSAKITPKKNLTLSPEFHGRAGEPGDKAREQRLSYQSRPFNTWNSCHTTNTASWTKFTTTVLYVDTVPPQRERACLDLF